MSGAPTATKLLNQARQIADFWRHQPGPPTPAEAIAGHINDFWPPAMRLDLLAALAAGAPADPLVAAAAPHIRRPGTPTEGAAPTDPQSHRT